MKEQKRQIPKLLGTAVSWQIRLDLGPGGGTIIMTYTNRDLAQRDYQRHKSTMSYGGHWIKGITYDEQT